MEGLQGACVPTFVGLFQYNIPGQARSVYVVVTEYITDNRPLSELITGCLGSPELGLSMLWTCDAHATAITEQACYARQAQLNLGVIRFHFGHQDIVLVKEPGHDQRRLLEPAGQCESVHCALHDFCAPAEAKVYVLDYTLIEFKSSVALPNPMDLDPQSTQELIEVMKDTWFPPDAPRVLN